MCLLKEFRNRRFISGELFQSCIRIEFHFPLFRILGECVHKEHFLESSFVFTEESLHIALPKVQMSLVYFVVNHKIRVSLEINVWILDPEDFELVF